MEEWKDIKEYEGSYQVSNLGRIRSLDRKVAHNIPGYERTVPGQVLPPRYNKFGYRQIILYKNKSRKTYLGHRLVAEAFIPNPDSLPIVRHWDDDPTNNKVSNLRWGTHQDNSDDKMSKNRNSSFPGESNPSAKLTQQQVREIRARLATKEYGIGTKLAKEYGVSEGAITLIKQNKNWQR